MAMSDAAMGGRRETGPAEWELSWWFTCSDAAQGLRAAFVPDAGAHAVWDEDRIHRAHMRPRTSRHRAALANVARIGPCVAAMRPELRARAAVVFTPRRWSVVRAGARRADGTADDSAPDPLAAATRRPGRDGCLAGLCLLTRAAKAAWAEWEAARTGLGWVPIPTRADLLAFLQDEAAGSRRRKVFRPIVAEAERLLAEAVAEYDVLRRARVAAERDGERAELARLAALGAGAAA